MKEQLITFETAKLAKEKGFNISTEQCYAETRQYSIYDPRSGDDLIFEYKSPRILPTNYTWDDKNTSIVCYAPTQALLQKWLRDVHNIHIKVDDFIDDETDVEWDYEIVMIGTDINEKGEYIPLVSYSTDDVLRQFLNYESALESALQIALKLIK